MEILTYNPGETLMKEVHCMFRTTTICCPVCCVCMIHAVPICA